MIWWSVVGFPTFRAWLHDPEGKGTSVHPITAVDPLTRYSSKLGRLPGRIIKTRSLLYHVGGTREQKLGSRLPVRCNVEDPDRR